MNNGIEILSTAELEPSLSKETRAKGINIDILPFIKTEPLQNIEIQQEIETIAGLTATVVFTSMNAVEAVAEIIYDQQPIWNIYCTGSITEALIRKLFPLSVVCGKGENANELALVILQDEPESEVTFFCGDRRRDELPNKLRDAGLEVNEIIVYQTILNPHRLEKQYAAILFYSPSGVESFFSMNKIKENTVLFAIGKTTALSIQQHTSGRIIMPASPSKEMLVKEVIDFFT